MTRRAGRRCGAARVDGVQALAPLQEMASARVFRCSCAQLAMRGWRKNEMSCRAKPVFSILNFRELRERTTPIQGQLLSARVLRKGRASPGAGEQGSSCLALLRPALRHDAARAARTARPGAERVHAGRDERPTPAARHHHGSGQPHRCPPLRHRISKRRSSPLPDPAPVARRPATDAGRA